MHPKYQGPLHNYPKPQRPGSFSIFSVCPCPLHLVHLAPHPPSLQSHTCLSFGTEYEATYRWRLPVLRCDVSKHLLAISSALLQFVKQSAQYVKNAAVEWKRLSISFYFIVSPLTGYVLTPIAITENETFKSNIASVPIIRLTNVCRLCPSIWAPTCNLYVSMQADWPRNELGGRLFEICVCGLVCLTCIGGWFKRQPDREVCFVAVYCWRSGLAETSFVLLYEVVDYRRRLSEMITK